MPYARKMDDSGDRKAADLYAEGRTAAEIAALLSVNPATIRAALHRLGVVLDRGPRVSLQQRRRMVELRASGSSFREIARELGISRNAAYAALHENFPAAARARHRPLTDAQVEQAATQFSAGCSALHIATELQVDPAAVRAALRRRGIHRGFRGSPSKVTPELLALMIERYAAGATISEVAALAGIGHTAATKHLVRAGTTIRSVGARIGSAHPNWKGGRGKSRGYIVARVYPEDPLYCMGVTQADGARYAFEHRLVVARHLGRPLTEHETVHHIDGNKENNDISNLQLRLGKHGKGDRFRCRSCGSNDIEAVELT